MFFGRASALKPCKPNSASLGTLRERNECESNMTPTTVEITAVSSQAEERSACALHERSYDVISVSPATDRAVASNRSAIGIGSRVSLRLRWPRSLNPRPAVGGSPQPTGESPVLKAPMTCLLRRIPPAGRATAHRCTTAGATPFDDPRVSAHGRPRPSARTTGRTTGRHSPLLVGEVHAFDVRQTS
jgi:hypothetical protein